MSRRFTHIWIGSIFAVLFFVRATPIARGSELTVSSDVRFSDLDGGVHDEDGSSNGILRLKALTVRSHGLIRLDVTEAEFDILGDLQLRGTGSIRAETDPTPTVGPTLSIFTGKSVRMTGSSRIDVRGTEHGGSLFICAQGSIELHGAASISASAFDHEDDEDEDDDDDENALGIGGQVRLQAVNKIRLDSGATYVAANGATGGSVSLVSCAKSDPAIRIRGTIMTIGFEENGGAIDLHARQSGISFGSGWPRLLAKGEAGDGLITVTAATTVSPNPPPAAPTATVIEDQPSDEPCDNCSMATEGDCDGNGVPDGQELADCQDDPSCDDCNLNGILDVCDIAQGTSQDVTLHDGVPDECFQFVDGCFPPSDLWSCFDNWELPGDQYPDDVNSARGVHVTLGAGDNAFLDVNATLPVLRLLPGSLLNLAQIGLFGDLDFSPPATVLNRGTILVANIRTIGADSTTPPHFTIGPDGVYMGDSAAASAVSSASLIVGGASNSGLLQVSDLVIQGGDCADPPRNGGVLELDETMSLNADGRVVLEGSIVADCDGAADSLRGGVSPPPKLGAGGNSSITIGGILVASSPAVAGLEGDPPAGTLSLTDIVEVDVRSSEPVVIRGDFDNQSTAPELFHWISGGLALDGTEPQAFEVAGRDLGPTVNGFDTGSDTNFSMGKVQVASNANVTFANAFGNILGSDPCDEALYVRELEFAPGALVTIDNCRVYYRTLLPNGVTPILLGCGELVRIPPEPALGGDNTCHAGAVNLGTPCDTNDDCVFPTVCGLKSRYLSVRPPMSQIAGIDEAMSIQVAVVDLPNGAGRQGETWWAGAEESVANAPFPNLRGAPLVCTPAPHAQAWTTGELHLFGAIIVPGSRYEVRMCDASGTNCSDPLSVGTGRWADAVAPFAAPGQPNFTDISAIVEKFRALSSSPITPRTDLEPAVPDRNTNFQDVTLVIDAFRGFSYSFALPPVCP